MELRLQTPDGNEPGAEPSAERDFGRRLTEALPRLRTHCARRAPALEADELAQEVLGRALRYAGSFDQRRALWPWLRQVAERVLADALAERAAGPEGLGEREPAVAESAPAIDELDELRRALAGLREVERDVLLRFHHRGQSVARIAAELGTPEGTVKSHLSRARRRLAQQEDERSNP